MRITENIALSISIHSQNYNIFSNSTNFRPEIYTIARSGNALGEASNALVSMTPSSVATQVIAGQRGEHVAQH